MSDAWNPGSPQAPSDFGPPAYRPLSALAVIGLVLAIVFLLGGIFGFWWLELLPVILCVLGWSAISKGRRRGGGLAIAATIIAILGGLASFGCAQTVRRSVREVAAPFVQALHDDDRAKLEGWATEDAQRPFAERADDWKKRLEAARARVGPWTKDVEVAGSIFFPYRFFLPFAPPELEEVEPKGGAAEARMTVWLRAPGERGDLWIGAELSDRRLDSKKLEEWSKDEPDKRKPLRLVHDVRIYVPPGAK